MKDWLAKYSKREQMIIIGIGSVFALWMLYFVIISPLLSYQERVNQDYERNKDVLVWTESAVQEYKRLSGGQQGSMASSGSVVVILETLIAQNQLGAPKRIEPKGNNQANVEFESVSFDGLVQTLSALSLQGIGVKKANIRKTDAVGVVSGSLTLERNG